ncbi:GyrI-like domain-containing protein [Paenibacillus sp. GCM10012307]|uniref:Effector binding domain-containing protein n=1 Tax=Paenibacillus roseus TaxID=2798579 RepID=A0A934J738_9BACL|nr:GyrI-like domain-containing protein [Paenibacillus roseus]MBJ6361580.1 effector binding domain-containing protein [Paenibacillus roseus]
MDNCMLVKKPSLHLAGISHSGPYSSFPDEVIRLRDKFLARKHELGNYSKSPALVCPHYGNEVFATYWVCYEVGQLEHTPPDMVQFTIPEHSYAMINCTTQRFGEGYERLLVWMKEQGLKKAEQAVSIEVYHFDEHLEEGLVDILIPVEAPHGD